MDADDPMLSALWTLTAVSFYVPVTVGSLAWLSREANFDPRWALERVLGDQPFVGGLAGAFAAVPIVLGTWVGVPRVPWLARMGDALANALGPLPAWTCFVLALASAFGEELLFRGVIQPITGLVGASVLFAVAHLPLERSLLPWPVFAFGAGLWFGWLSDATGALVAPITAHFAVNFLNLLWIARRHRAARAHGFEGFDGFTQ